MAPASKVASWILTPPGDPPTTATRRPALITVRCEELNATRTLVREFAEMLCHRHGERMEPGPATPSTASPASEPRGFSKGLRNDWAAVTRRAHRLQ